MRNACWITKATGTHSEYVIDLLIAFPWQQWFHERVSMLRLYVYCLPRSMLHLKKYHVLKGSLLSNFKTNFVYYWQNVFKCYFMIQRNISTLQLFFIFKKGTSKHNWNISKNNRIYTVELNKRWVPIPTLQTRDLRYEPYPVLPNQWGFRFTLL